MFFSLPTWALAILIFGVVFLGCVVDRGLINVPAGPLVSLQHELAQPPAAAAP